MNTTRLRWTATLTAVDTPVDLVFTPDTEAGHPADSGDPAGFVDHDGDPGTAPDFTLTTGIYAWALLTGDSGAWNEGLRHVKLVLEGPSGVTFPALQSEGMWVGGILVDSLLRFQVSTSDAATFPITLNGTAVLAELLALL